MNKDKSGNEVNINDILFAVKGTSLKHYVVKSFLDSKVECQEVDADFQVYKNPRGKKFAYLTLSECLLHSKMVKNKYIKVL